MSDVIENGNVSGIEDGTTLASLFKMPIHDAQISERIALLQERLGTSDPMLREKTVERVEWHSLRCARCNRIRTGTGDDNDALHASETASQRLRDMVRRGISVPKTATVIPRKERMNPETEIQTENSNGLRLTGTDAWIARTDACLGMNRGEEEPCKKRVAKWKSLPLCEVHDGRLHLCTGGCKKNISWTKNSCIDCALTGRGMKNEISLAQSERFAPFWDRPEFVPMPKVRSVAGKERAKTFRVCNRCDARLYQTSTGGRVQSSCVGCRNLSGVALRKLRAKNRIANMKP